MKDILFLIILCGFIYGIKYFKFYEPYGLNNTCIDLGYYILAVKWWNIEFNWFTYNGKWQVDFKVRFITNWNPRKYKEKYMIFDSEGVRVFTLDIY